MTCGLRWCVEMKPYVEFQCGGRLGEFNGMSSQIHLPHCKVLPPGEFNVMIPELRVTLQGAAARWIQWHVISEAEAHITLQGAATWWIHCHDSRGTSHIAGCSHLAKSMSWSCHIAWCKNSIRHSENLFLPYFILMQFKLWRAAAFVSSPIHLFSYKLFQLGYGPYKNAATEHTWSRFSKWLKVLLQFHEHYSSSTKPKTRQLEVTAGNW